MAGDADPLIPQAHRRRRLKRRLLNLLTALSLMLCIATAALWVRSYFVSDRLFRQFVRETDARDDWAQEALHCGRGRVGVARVVQPVYWAPEDRHGQRATRGIPFHSVGPPQDPDFNFQPAVQR